MNSQPELSSDVAGLCPETEAREADAETSASGQEPMPLKASEPAATKQPTLLDRFYYWVMSRT